MKENNYQITDSVSGTIKQLRADSPREALLVFILDTFDYTDQQTSWSFDIEIELLEGK